MDNQDSTVRKRFVSPRKRIPLILRIMVWIADKKAGKEMLLGRILIWSSMISISSGLLELMVERGAARILDRRLIKMLRIIISYTVPSMFALDINCQDYAHFHITPEELEGLRGAKAIDTVTSFSNREKAALLYAGALSKTPVLLTQKLLNGMRDNFSAKEITAVAALTAKVHYWARLSEALRIPSAGFTSDPVLHLEDYTTLRE